MSAKKIRTAGMATDFVYGGAHMPLKIMKCQKRKGQLAFSLNQQQLVNWGNKIPLPGFGNLNFQPKHPNRSICISLHKYQCL